MDIRERFLNYASAFEVGVDIDDWTSVPEYFTPNARYTSIDGESSSGRDNIVSFFQASVANIDRKFDKRDVAELDLQKIGENQLFMHWQNTFATEGAPELVVSGTARVTYEGDLISILHDELDEGVAERLGNWMQQHGAKLAK